MTGHELHELVAEVEKPESKLETAVSSNVRYHKRYLGK